jgi:hypothetical protein
MVAVAIIGSAVIGGAASAIGSSKAASAQRDAANQANDRLNAQYAQTRSDLLPFQQAGQAGLNDLTSRMSQLTSPFSMSQADLEATPGYQFNRTQGLKAVNNAMGARGLMNSGAVMKGAANFATGLADSTYASQFNMDQQNKQNAYNKLMGVAQLGENAAAQTGSFGTQIAGSVANNTIGAGNATAAGDIGVANSIGSIGNSLSQYYMMKSMFGGGGGDSGGIFGSSTTRGAGNGFSSSTAGMTGVP